MIWNSIEAKRAHTVSSFLSSVFLPKMVSYFYFRILIGYLGILGLLHRRMVVVSHLFRPQRF